MPQTKRKPNQKKNKKTKTKQKTNKQTKQQKTRQRKKQTRKHVFTPSTTILSISIIYTTMLVTIIFLTFCRLKIK